MSEPSQTLEAVTAELEKLKRRQERNYRAHFARGLMQGILSMLTPKDVVFDCGANIGEVTAPLAATGATVHAFEPDPYAFERLTKRVGKLPNVTLHNAAVGVTSGSVRLMRADNFADNPKGGSVKSTIVSGGRKINENTQDTIEVDLLALPDLIRDAAQGPGEIAFLKMDIEGAELDILEHMHQERLFDQVRLTVAETHENKFRDLRRRFAKLRETISAAYPITHVNLDWI